MKRQEKTTEKNNSLQKNIAHTYGIHRQSLETVLLYVEESIGFSTKANPDFHLYRYDTIGIKEAREIVENSTKSPFKGDKSLSLIYTDSIGPEAQNALLKAVEDATSHIFVFSLNSPKSLLETLRSRIINEIKDGDLDKVSNEEGEKNIGKLINDFLRKNIADRVKIAEKMNDDVKKEKMSRIDVMEFVKGIEMVVYEMYKVGKIQKDALKVVFKAIVSLESKGSSIKQTLEYLGMRLPTPLGVV